MPGKLFLYFVLASFFLIIIFMQLNCSNNSQEMSNDAMVTKGAHLVQVLHCDNCHSPKIITADGMVTDSTRRLAGHWGTDTIPNVDAKPVTSGKWILSSVDFNTWIGPWGVSFPANLTPDKPTGLGNWSAEVFMNALRNNKHMGMGRALLPPMSKLSYGHLTDDELKAIFAYLKTLPPVRNKVPEPIPPDKLSSLK